MALTLVATPIGNLGDLSSRAVQSLTEADWWFVEDTRVSGKLLSHLGLKKPMKVLNEHTSPERIMAYADSLKEGNAVLITDGGCPGISDPGAYITDLCYERGVKVTAVPGPSAPINALMLSGFFAQRFVFLGFLGRKTGAIREELSVFADSALTIVLFESPHRFGKVLETASEVLGDRRYAICREMTKMFEQVYRGRLPLLPSLAEVAAKGEFSIVIEGKRKR